MAYEALTDAECDVDTPGSAELFQKIKGNFDYFYSQAGDAAAKLMNPSFEIDADADGVPDNWIRALYPGGSAGLYATDPVHGEKAWYATHPGGAGNGGASLESNYVAVGHGTSYILQYTLWATAAGMKLQILIEYFDKDKVAISTDTLYSSTTNPTSATRYRAAADCLFTTPATCNFLKIKLIGGFTDTDVAGTAYFDDLNFFEDPVADALISIAKLKISACELSTGSPNNLVVTGGTLCHWPSLKNAAGPISCSVANAASSSASYVTIVYLDVSTGTTYAYFSYHTSSGEIFWLYFLRNKATRQIISAVAAPDHPCFGNGGDPVLLPHPFNDYDPAIHDIIVVNPDAEQIRQIKAQARGRSFLQTILEDFDLAGAGSAKWPGIPVTTGIIDNDETIIAAGQKVNVIKRIIPQPHNISVESLCVKKQLIKP